MPTETAAARPGRARCARFLECHGSSVRSLGGNARYISKDKSGLVGSSVGECLPGTCEGLDSVPNAGREGENQGQHPQTQWCWDTRKLRGRTASSGLRSQPGLFGAGRARSGPQDRVLGPGFPPAYGAGGTPAVPWAPCWLRVTSQPPGLVLASTEGRGLVPPGRRQHWAEVA